MDHRHRLGLLSGVGILSIALGPRIRWILVASDASAAFSPGFIYNNAVACGNKWFADEARRDDRPRRGALLRGVRRLSYLRIRAILAGTV